MEAQEKSRISALPTGTARMNRCSLLLAGHVAQRQQRQPDESHHAGERPRDRFPEPVGQVGLTATGV
jgi:hypothetical protein